MTSIQLHTGHKILRRFNVTEEQMKEMTNQTMMCPTCVITEKMMSYRSITIRIHAFVRTTTSSWKKTILFSYPYTGQASKNESDVRICVVWIDVAWGEKWRSRSGALFYALIILIISNCPEATRAKQWTHHFLTHSSPSNHLLWGLFEGWCLHSSKTSGRRNWKPWRPIPF